MPDTARSTDALLALFADNGTKAIHAQAARDLIRSAVLFCGLWSSDEQYYAGNLVLRLGVPYLAYVGNNDTDPSTDGGVHWIQLGGSGDLSVPDAPALVSAVAGDASVVLTWTASTGAAAYTVRRSTTSGGPYSVVSGGQPDVGFTDAGVANGTSYFYIVTAQNPAGEGDATDEVSATPGAGAGDGVFTFDGGTLPASINGSSGVTGVSSGGNPGGALSTTGYGDWFVIDSPDWTVSDGQLWTFSVDLNLGTTGGGREIANIGFALSGSDPTRPDLYAGLVFRVETTGGDGGFYTGTAGSGITSYGLATATADVTAGDWYRVTLANSGTGGKTITATVVALATSTTVATQAYTSPDPLHGTFGQVADGASDGGQLWDNVTLTITP